MYNLTHQIQQTNWGDWTYNKGVSICFLNSHTCQMFAFSFARYRTNNPLVDHELDFIDTNTPSGV